MRSVRWILFRNIQIGLIVILCALFLTSCSSKTEQEEIGNGIISDTEQSSEQEEGSDEMEELKNAIKVAVNNDIWYDGPNSDLKYFSMEESKIEIYTDQDPDLIYVYLDRLFKAGGYNEGNERYFVIIIGKGKKGYDSELVGLTEYSTPEDAREGLKEKGYSLYKTGEISFGEVTEPTFTPMSDKKNKIIDDIESEMIDRLKDWPKEGKFTIYILNFNEDIDEGTYAVIQDENGTEWISSVGIQDNGLIFSKKFLEVGVDAFEYRAEQYKKLSFKREVVL